MYFTCNFFTLQNDPNHLVRILLQLLKRPEQQIANCSAGVIYNLTCRKDTIKLAVCEADGIFTLLKVIEDRGSDKDLFEPAVGILKHLTNGEELAVEAQRVLLKNAGALPTLKFVTEIHAKKGHWPSLKAFLGLLRNLAKPVGKNSRVTKPGITKCQGGVETINMVKQQMCNLIEHCRVHTSEKHSNASLTHGSDVAVLF